MNLLTFAKTHTASSPSASISISISVILFSWPLSQDFSRSSCEKTRGKAQRRYSWMCCLTECTATADTLHPFCIVQAFSCSLSQSATPSNTPWIKCYDSLKQEPSLKTADFGLLWSFCAANGPTFHVNLPSLYLCGITGTDFHTK